ncbi:TLD [Cordylochernes scorpioides]|uniref:TLD n=1 Tax=Cordylochernes scorpioides TaxID=51811 RepID=A0ABY6JWK9_9ARAC|nr:TLD [Cordylochernes scorpioides]
MEEEDVWRAVIRWAKHKAGVTQPPQHWTEEERARVAQCEFTSLELFSQRKIMPKLWWAFNYFYCTTCLHMVPFSYLHQLIHIYVLGGLAEVCVVQFLPGVVNHVRLLMIDSQVFAEEVEPTGVVPIELSLERYRFAALPSKFSQEDRRLQPRTCLRLFNNSTLLSGEKVQLQRLLNAWYGAPKQTWRLLFRASTHGYSSEAFHMHCDGHGPTFVLALTLGIENGSLGFYHVPQAGNAVVLLSYGPIFGAGADLCIASNCNHNMSSYSNLPHSYDGEHASSTILMGDYNFNVADYEVFTPQQNK